MIELETIRRLHFSAGLSFQEIDNTRVLSRPVDPSAGHDLLDLPIRRWVSLVLNRMNGI